MKNVILILMLIAVGACQKTTKDTKAICEQSARQVELENIHLHRKEISKVYVDMCEYTCHKAQEHRDLVSACQQMIEESARDLNELGA